MQGIDSGGFEIKKDEPRWKHMQKDFKGVEKAGPKIGTA
jgi:hypothetical protein